MSDQPEGAVETGPLHKLAVAAVSFDQNYEYDMNRYCEGRVGLILPRKIFPSHTHSHKYRQ